MNIPEVDENGEKIVDEKSASTTTLVETTICPPPKAPPLPGTQGAPAKKVYKESDRGGQFDTSSLSSTDTTSSGSAREHAKILENVLAKGAAGPPERKPFTYTPHLEELKAASKRWKRFKDAECVATSKSPLQPEHPVTCFPETEAPKKFEDGHRRQYQSPSLMNIDRWTATIKPGPSDSTNFPQNTIATPMTTRPHPNARDIYYHNDGPAPFKMAPEIHPTQTYHSVPFAVERHDRANPEYISPNKTFENGHANFERKEASPPIPINIKVVKKPNSNQTTTAPRNMLGPRMKQGSSYLVPYDRAIPVEIVNEITSPLPNANQHVTSRAIPFIPGTTNGIIKGAKSCSSLLNANGGQNEHHYNYPNNVVNFNGQNSNDDKWKLYRGPTEVDPSFRHSVYREMEARPWGKDFNIVRHVITPARSTDYLDADVRKYLGNNPNIIPQKIWITKQFYAHSKEGELPETYLNSVSERDWVEMRGTTDF